MRHPNDNRLYPQINTPVNQSLHARDQGFPALETESFVGGVLCGEETFKGIGPDETVEDTTFFVHVVFVGDGDFETFAEPVAAATVGDVDVLDTVGTTVQTFAVFDDFFEGHGLFVFCCEAGQNTRAESEFFR